MNGNTGKASPIVAWIIHFANIMAIPVYAVVATFVLAPQAGHGKQPGSPEMFLAIFTGISVISIILALTAPNWLMNVFTAKKVYKNHKGTAAGYLEREIMKLVLIDSFYESIAVYGVVGQVVGFKLWQSYIFMAVGFIALLFRIPAVRNVTDTYYQLKGSEEIG